MNNLRNFALWVIIALLLIALFNLFQNTGNRAGVTDIGYSQFAAAVKEGEVKSITIEGMTINGTYQNGQTFKTLAPSYIETSKVEEWIDKGIDVKAAPPEEGMPTILSIILSWFPMLILIAVWIFFMRQMQSGGGKAMGFGKSRAKLLTERHGRVTFEDVAGIDEAKEELQEIGDFL